MSVAVLLNIEGKECVRSDHCRSLATNLRNDQATRTGLISAAPAGKLKACTSLNICNSASVNPPPAESPATTICSGLTGLWGASGGGSTRYR
jgi:hypothetical protein